MTLFVVSGANVKVPEVFVPTLTKRFPAGLEMSTSLGAAARAVCESVITKLDNGLAFGHVILMLGCDAPAIHEVVEFPSIRFSGRN